MRITREKKNTSINNFKNVNLPFLQGIRFNIFLFAPTITKTTFGEPLGVPDIKPTHYLKPTRWNLFIPRKATKKCLTRPYIRACHQTNFSQGEWRKEGTPFSFDFLNIFFTLFSPLPFLALFPFLRGIPGQLEVHLTIEGR